MATKAEVKARALELLGIKMIGQSAQSQDDTRIGAAYDEVYEYLKTLGLATWASTDSVPTELVPHVVALVAMNPIDDYSVSNARYQRILLQASAAEPSIRKLITPDYESLEEPDDF